MTPRTGRPDGFTLVEALVVIGIVGLLLAIAVPATLSTREAARRAGCQNNLRQMGAALAGFESAQGRLPPGRDAREDWQHSWATAVLPMLDQPSLFDRYNWEQPCDAPSNRTVATTSLAVFACPSSVDRWDGKTDYGGCQGGTLPGQPVGYRIGWGWEAGTFPPAGIPGRGPYRRRGVAFSEVRDGTSQTFLVLEDADRPARNGGRWADGQNCFAVGLGSVNASRSKQISSRHPGGAFSLMGDGSARFLSDSAASSALNALATRSGGELVSDGPPR